MANPGVGNKFVSVNLNKSYGQPSHHNHSSNPSSYGSSRTRSGGHGGGGGMVVLTRPRSSQKVGPKLSVPPPLNLPSLRKEHERFDSLGSGGGATGGISGTGPRPTSSSMGWTKPGMIGVQEKEGFTDQGTEVDQGLHSIDGGSKGSSVYLPPSARSGMVGRPGSSSGQPQPMVVAEKATVLRGEDFPSLQAALPSTSGPTQKQKDGLNQKVKQGVGNDPSNEQNDGSLLRSHVDMCPQVQSSHRAVGNGSIENALESNNSGGSWVSERIHKKEDYFPGPLPLVRLNPRSDWADDERDTSFGLTDRGRDHGFPRSEAYWERDFDMPRVSVLPQKPIHNHFDRWGQRENETGKVTSGDVPKVDHFGKDVRMPTKDGRESNSWRAASLPKDGIRVPEVENDRNGTSVRLPTLNKEPMKENKYTPSPFRDNANNDIGRMDIGYGQGGRQPWNNNADLYSSRATERNTRERYHHEHNNKYRGDSFQNNSASKSSYLLGGKGLSVNDPVLNFGRERHSLSKSEKAYLEDPFMKDFAGTGFDGRDPFSGGLVGVVKRKKDMPKQIDFHDPVRESFEAELERVQKMQEEERQRIIEEQERVLELARREEEERARLAREQEERQRRLEEQAREAAWRAEQERLEAMQRAEEQRIAREEEKRRILMEEERRKEAAKQKLLDLEQRMAKRQAEATKAGTNSVASAEEKMSGILEEKDASRLADIGDWEDGERMVERITTSASSDSSSLNRPFEIGSKSHFLSDGSLGFMDRARAVNSWKRDVHENGSSSNFLIQDQENGHHGPRKDGSVNRSFSRKEFYGGAGFMSSRTQHRGGIADPHMDDFTHPRGHVDHYGRNIEIDTEYHESFVEKFGDTGWVQGHSRGSLYPQDSDQSYPNAEADGPYSLGRLRYSMRQPRVLPPPSVTSMHKTTYRVENEHPGPSAFLENEVQYGCAARSESHMQIGYDDSHEENIGQRGIIDVQQQSVEKEKPKVDNNDTLRCDSQSSLSVSSPPNSPTHLSHDDLDESGDSAVVSASGECKDASLSEQENEPVGLSTKVENENMMTTATALSTGDDEEWTIENDEQLQEQEEYDEDEDGYQEEDEVHEGDQEFEDMHLEEKGSPSMMDNLVLGFNEGVAVGMPNDELERNSRNEESTFVIPQGSTGPVEVRGSFEGLCGDGQALQPMDVGAQVSIDGPSRMFQETEKAMQDLVIDPNNVTHTSVVSEILGHVEASSSSSVPAQPPVPSSVNLASHSSSGPPVMPTVPAVPSQADVPVKLQFGLFSGPSLIPSPVPAIQIGSIQMPLHLHPQVGPSVTHIHPSRPPLFQFGQLRYTSPISQGVLPLAPQSMSFVQPNVPGSFSLNRNAGGPLPIQTGQDTAHNLMKDNSMSLATDNQPGIVSRPLDLSQVNISKEVNSLPARENVGNMVKMQQGHAEVSHFGDKSARSESRYQEHDPEHQNAAENNYNSLVDTRESERLHQNEAGSSQLVSKGKDLSGSKVQRPVSGGRGKRYVFTAKNPASRSYQAADASRIESSGYQRRPRRNIQRTEFRVRESADKRQSTDFVSSDHITVDDKSRAIGRGTDGSARSAPRKVGVSNKQLQRTLDSECMGSGPTASKEMDSGSRAEKGSGKETLTKSQNIIPSGEGTLKRNICSEEDADATLQSGIVRVFEQPGIEAPSDEDDFIEVRSKRQMLNDRREQREKESKAKSRVSKMPRKPRSTSQNSIIPAKLSKITAPTSGELSKGLQSSHISSDGCRPANIEVSAGFNAAIISQPLAPIGTPPVKTDSQADVRSQGIRSVQTSSIPVVTGSVQGKSIGPGVIFEGKNKVVDNVQTSSLSSWGDSQINQQVMPLTQTQLDEAMKPEQFDSHSSVGDQNSSVSKPTMPSSSILAKDKSFSSAASPINSLLAGEKIQFGAVTSPTILPPSNRAVSLGIGPPGPCRSDIQLSHNLPGAENDCSLFFEKEKCASDPCDRLEDCEAEAEAAASAVAVAAISSDEIVGNGLGNRSVSLTDTKGFGAEIDGITAGGDQQLASQSRAEESLSVSLPVDLSVETPPISLWPPLPSPQNSSSQMLSHFPGGPPSHFPFYEMNHVLGGPIFAFGPHDESSSTAQPQSQKSSTSAAGPVGPWQQCHSGVDSFYGPAGFTGPFISPPGGIPGVQGPPHMVVYNHFAPVGQFGQVGLSFMGTTYIPSGKQPDWKHNPVSSSMTVGEGDISNLNMVSAQRNPSNMPATLQHLAPGSPLLPMPSPLAMFDVSPFQSSSDLSVQAHWQHVPASPIQSVPLSMPLPKPLEGVHTSPFSHGPSINQSLTANRFADSRSSAPSDSNQNFPVATDATVTQLPDELGLVDPSSSTTTGPPAPVVVTNSSSVNTIRDVSKIDVQTDGSRNGSGQNTSSTLKTHSSEHKSTSAQQYSHSSGYNYQRGNGISQKNSSGAEWSHRRMRFQGRNQSLGAEKSFPSSKMKQIYVAKQTASGTQTTS